MCIFHVHDISAPNYPQFCVQQPCVVVAAILDGATQGFLHVLQAHDRKVGPTMFAVVHQENLMRRSRVTRSWELTSGKDCPLPGSHKLLHGHCQNASSLKEGAGPVGSTGAPGPGQGTKPFIQS